MTPQQAAAAALQAGADGPPSDAASGLDRPYDRLSALPRSVWLPTLISAVGSREDRLDHARGWMQALLAGRLPDDRAHFGDPAASSGLRLIVGRLELPALCQGVGALAEQVIRTMLWHLDRIPDLQPARTRAEAIAQVQAEFEQAWAVETEGLRDELEWLRGLADAAELRWDRLRGQLRSREWQAARRAAERLRELPELAALIHRLGRSEARPSPRPTPDPSQPEVRHQAPMRAVATRLEGVPGEVTGVRFDHRLEGMLPSEAVLLHHALGRRLWRARWAEGRLLAHDSTGVLVDWRPDPQAPPRESPPTDGAVSREHGPLVLCLDTSGSMRGAPEAIARAVVIAAVQAAHASRRGCKLIAFGGQGELLERDLATGSAAGSAAGDGLAALLELMGQAFDGGTDIQTPIERAIERVHEEAWQSADLLIVSDGEFGCVRSTLESLDAARATLGLRVQGVLIGDRETMGLLEVCDDIHWVRDWRRHADAVQDGGEACTAAPGGRPSGRSPVHSKSLTALYFPNALSSYAARHRRGGSAAEGAPPAAG